MNLRYYFVHIINTVKHLSQCRVYVHSSYLLYEHELDIRSCILSTQLTATVYK